MLQKDSSHLCGACSARQSNELQKLTLFRERISNHLDELANLLTKDFVRLNDPSIVLSEIEKHESTSGYCYEQGAVLSEGHNLWDCLDDDNRSVSSTKPVEIDDLFLSDAEHVPEAMDTKNETDTLGTGAKLRRLSTLRHLSIGSTENDDASLATPCDRWKNLTSNLLLGEVADYCLTDSQQGAEIQPTWLTHGELGRPLTLFNAVFADRNSAMMKCRSEVQTLDERLTACVMQPRSRRLLCWTFIGFAHISYDVVTVPVRYSFQLEEPPFFQTIWLVMLAYWYADIVVNFFTSFSCADGRDEVCITRIARHYMQTWFLADCTIVFVDTFLLVVDATSTSSSADGSDDFSGIGKTLRMVRNVRILRMLRAVRLRKVARMIKIYFNDIRSKMAGVILKLTAHLVLMVLVAHYVACAWYVVGMNPPSGTDSWVKHYSVNVAGFERSYSMSLHWSLTQFTPSTQNISPQNSRERCFSILVVIFGLFSFSSFVSGITNAVQKLRAMTEDRMKEAGTIRDFVADRRLSFSMSHDLMCYFDNNFSRATRACESDIRLFKTIPHSMLLKLRSELYMPVIKTHGALRIYARYETGTFEQVCYQAMMEKSYSKGQDVFMPGTESTFMHTLVIGSLTFTSTDTIQTTIDIAEWVSEYALWIKWRHSGMLTAVAVADIVSLDCELFRTVITSVGGRIFRSMRAYAVCLASFADEQHVFTDLPVHLPFVDRLLNLHGYCVDIKQFEMRQKSVRFPTSFF